MKLNKERTEDIMEYIEITVSVTGIYFWVALIWQNIEKFLYGTFKESTIDSIIAAIISATIYIGYSCISYLVRRK